MTVKQELYFVQTDDGERLHFVEKTSCCGAKVYPNLMHQLRLCPVCGEPLEQKR